MERDKTVFKISALIALALLIMMAAFTHAAAAEKEPEPLYLGQAVDFPEQWRLIQILNGWAIFVNDVVERHPVNRYWVAIDLSTTRLRTAPKRGDNLMFAPWPPCYVRMPDIVIKDANGFEVKLRPMMGSYKCRGAI